MALPAKAKEDAVEVVATYCATKIPAEHDDEIRIEYKIREVDDDPTCIFWG